MRGRLLGKELNLRLLERLKRSWEHARPGCACTSAGAGRGGEAMISTMISTISQPPSHAGPRVGSIFTWQHQKSDVPKGETRTD